MRQLKAMVTPSQMQDEAKRVFARIRLTTQFAQASNILLYHSLPDELPTLDIIDAWSQEKNIFLPRVNGDSVDIVPADSSLSRSNRFHIAEPQGEPVNPDVIDLIIVPAVALDPQGHRLGRGKGYYDRLLATTSAFSIGVALECQLVNAVPCEPHDITLNAVITSTHFYLCNS